MKPTIIIDAPWKEKRPNKAGILRHTLVYPTDIGVFTVREMAEMMDISVSCMRNKIRTNEICCPDTFQLLNPGFQPGHSINKKAVSARMTRALKLASIKIGTWEAANL